MAETDIQTGRVTLTKSVFTVMLLSENGNVVLQNEDIYDLYFVEDIYKFCMVGKLIYNDRWNFLEYGPFTGNEKIVIIYGTEFNEEQGIRRDERQMVFDIWKIGKISQAGPGIRETSENQVEIDFVDTFFPAYNLRNYSRSWKNEKYSDIMRDILNNMVFVRDGGFDLNIEESSNSTDFIMPNWNPRTALMFLMRRAKGKTSGTSGYLCFNNTKNKLSTNVLTMNYLLADTDKTLDKRPFRFQSSELSYKNKILEWWINSLDRTSQTVIRGGTWRGYDFMTKKLLNVPYGYSEPSSKNIMLGRKTLYPPLDDTRSVNVQVGDNSIENLTDIAFNDWAMRYNLQFILSIIVEGDDSRFAGQHIDVEWPSSQGGSDQGLFNEALKGKYMIKSVTHSFFPGGTYPYRQRLVCIKNSYHDIRSQTLHPSDVMNLATERNVSSIIKRD